MRNNYLKHCHWYYIRIKSKKDPESIYYGSIYMDKTEKKAINTALGATDPKQSNYEVVRVKEIPEKVALRFQHVTKVRHDIEAQKKYGKKSGKNAQKLLMKELAPLAVMSNALSDHRYY